VKAIGYFHEQGGKGGQSLAEQSRAFLEFCRVNGYEATATFLDAATQDSERPGYRQLVDFLRQRPDRGFTLVVVPSLVSLGDDLRQVARRYFQLASMGVKVMSLEDGDDVSTALLCLWTEKEGERLGQ